MHTMKETTAKFLSDMRLVVIENHISELMYIIDGQAIRSLIKHTNEFALKDTCNIETTNPVIYGVAMKHFVFSLMWDYEYTSKRMDSFDVVFNEYVNEHWFEFVDHFSEFTRLNLETIVSDAEKESE